MPNPQLELALGVPRDSLGRQAHYRFLRQQRMLQNARRRFFAIGGLGTLLLFAFYLGYCVI